MALDELHARRLSAVITVVEDALDRIELLLRDVERGGETAGGTTPDPAQVRSLRLAVHRMRRRLLAASERFEVARARPHWRQKLAAELSTLWVVLENAMPRRLKGYGREFSPLDREDWEAMIRDLMHELESVRQAVPPADSAL